MMASVITVVITTVVVVTLIMLHPYAVAQKTVADICMDAETRDKTRALMFEGITPRWCTTPSGCSTI